MYDSVTCTDIPQGVEMVAFYVDGAYAWSDACLQRFPGARKVGITVTGATLDANVADVENGDLSPAQGAAWLARKKAAGQIGTLYFSLGNWPAVHAAALAAGLSDAGEWLTWVAKWDGVAALSPGWTAKQYANPTLSGHHYDLSIVSDYWPGVDPAPATGPTPGPTLTPPPPPVAGAGGSNLDQARAAWASLGTLLTQVIPDEIIRIEQAVAQLRKL